MNDLAAWLTRIWDEDEQWARQIGQPDGFHPDPYEPEAPAHHAKLLARIAADRKILALHSGSAVYCAWTHDDRDTHQSYGPCDTVRLLAMPHADRPGYREEWRP